MEINLIMLTFYDSLDEKTNSHIMIVFDSCFSLFIPQLHGIWNFTQTHTHTRHVNIHQRQQISISGPDFIAAAFAEVKLSTMFSFS